jgi:hypothetical protein
MCVTTNTQTNCGSCGNNCTTQGRTCNGTECKVPDGQPCVAAADCLSGACNTFFRDADGDMQGTPSNTTKICTQTTPPAGYVTNSNDCCDSNSMVHRYDPLGPPAPFSKAPAPSCAQPWNFNCDNLPMELEIPNFATCTTTDLNFPCDTFGSGWDPDLGPVPACGVTGQMAGFCFGDESFCSFAEPFQVVQGCR